MAFRVLANMFQIPSFRNTVLAQLHPILVQCNDYRNSSHKHVRLSIATLLLNLSVQMYQTSTPLPDIVDIVALLVEFLQHETDSETLYRTVTAIGTLIALNTTFKPYLDAFSIKSLLRQSLEKETELRTLQAIQACLDLM
ncbi:hypothetical protein HMI54_012131 [Coelomomyces lativittatus]|nr:hypothetical protein HMI54_012131 [Coelomomyces lativittatus]